MRELDPYSSPDRPACAVVGAGRLGTVLAAALGAAEPLLLDPIWNWDVAVNWAANEMRTLDLRDDLANITVPTAIHAGTEDPQYPRASIEEVVEGIPHATVRWYDGARHSVFRDRPSVNAAIRSFVTGS